MLFSEIKVFVAQSIHKHLHPITGIALPGCSCDVVVASSHVEAPVVPFTANHAAISTKQGMMAISVMMMMMMMMVMTVTI